MAGFLDEAAFWERFLSDEELEALWHDGYGISYPFDTIDGPASLSDEIPLYLVATVGSSGEIPLYIGGVIPGSGERGMNLYISGRAYDAESSIPLFLLNTGISGCINLFIRGSGTASPTSEGWGFTDKSMNLFIKCPVSEGIPLYLHGPGAESSGVRTLYISGSEPASGLIPLSVPNVLGYSTKVGTLFVRGF